MSSERELLERVSSQVAPDRRRPAFVRPMNVDPAEYEEQIRNLVSVNLSLLDRIEALEGAATAPASDDGHSDLVTRRKRQ